MGYLSGGLAERHAATTKQDLLQLDNAWRRNMRGQLGCSHKESHRTVTCMCPNSTHRSISWSPPPLCKACTSTQSSNVTCVLHRDTRTSSNSLPSFSPQSSAGEPALTWLTKIPVWFPPTIVISSARLALLIFGERGGLEGGERKGVLRDVSEGQH